MQLCECTNTSKNPSSARRGSKGKEKRRSKNAPNLLLILLIPKLLPIRQLKRLKRIISLLRKPKPALLILGERLINQVLEDRTGLDLLRGEVEELVAVVAAEPFVEVGESAVVGADVGEGDLVRGVAA
jgi:hypothetical protein